MQPPGSSPLPFCSCRKMAGCFGCNCATQIVICRAPLLPSMCMVIREKEQLIAISSFLGWGFLKRGILTVGNSNTSVVCRLSCTTYWRRVSQSLNQSISEKCQSIAYQNHFEVESKISTGSEAVKYFNTYHLSRRPLTVALYQTKGGLKMSPFIILRFSTAGVSLSLSPCLSQRQLIQFYRQTVDSGSV